MDISLDYVDEIGETIYKELALCPQISYNVLGKEVMTEVAPILLSIIACERVVVDKISGMCFVNGIVQTINAPKYPARHARIVFFAELTNGHGQVYFSVKLVDVREDDEVVWEASKIPVNFKDVKQNGNIVLDLQGLVFPHEGEYRFQLLVGEQCLGERRIVCRKIELKKKGGE